MNKLIAIFTLLPMAGIAQLLPANNEDSLKRAALFLDPVEVRAIRAADNAPFTKNSLSGEEIRAANLGQDLPFILNQTPSVVVNSDAGNGVGYTGIRIRGSDATRINMTINGIPYNDAESQGLYFVDLPDLASSLSDVQIQRGIGTSSNGAGAFGATMNFSTNAVITKPGGEINNSFGSFNTWKNTVKASSGLIGDHFTIDARLSRISSDGYIDRASTDLQSFYLSAAYLTKNSSLRFNAISGKEKTYQAWNGIPESDLQNHRTMNYSGTEKPGDPYDNETDNYQQDHYQLFFNHRFNDHLDFNTAFFLTPGKGYYENYKADQPFSAYGLSDINSNGDTVSSTDLVRRLWLDNKYYGQILSVQYKRSSTDLTFGGGWNTYSGHHFGEVTWAQTGFPVEYRYYDLPARKTDVNSYVKVQQRIATGLEAFADVQYRYINYYLGGFESNRGVIIDNRYSFVNPKVGLSQAIRNGRIYLSYSYASKEPNRDDFEAGINEQPRPERMHDAELGVEVRKTHASWGANVFYMKYQDQLIPTGKINDVGAYTRINIPNSYRLGIEVQGKITPVKWVSASANVALSSNRVTNFTQFYDDYDDGGQKSVLVHKADIAFSPAVVGGYTLTFRPFTNASFNLIGKYVSRQFLDNSSLRSRSLDPYYVQDARLSYSLFHKFFDQVDFIFQVNNLLNEKYEANGYTFSYLTGGSLTTENYYFPMAPTNVMFGVNITL